MVLSQGIHFWGYFGDLAPKTQNRGPNYPILGKNRVKFDFFGDHFEHHANLVQQIYLDHCIAKKKLF